MEAFALCLFWALAIYAFYRGSAALMVLFFVSSAFVSFAVVPPALSGGVSLTATPATSLLIILRELGNRKGLAFAIRASTRFDQLGFLILFWLVAAFSTLFMPRLFADQVMVMPMRAALLSEQTLQPTAQNITQLLYLSVSVFLVVAVVRIATNIRKRQLIIDGVAIFALTLIVTGILDILSQYIPLAWLLDGFRNATYTLRTNDDVFGTKRIVGLTTEASVFGEYCLTALVTLYFLKPAMTKDGLIYRYRTALLIALLLLVCLSTSSSAYVGLGVFFGVAALEWTWRVIRGQNETLSYRVLRIQFPLVLVMLFVFTAMLLFVPSVFDPVVKYVDELVFQKTASSSYAERNLATAVSLQSAFDTYGLGVGVGGTRASSSLVAGLSNFGLIGASLYCIFVLVCYFRQAAPEDKQGARVLTAFRWSMIAPTVIGWLIATSPDFGNFRAILYGTMIAISLPVRRQDFPGQFGTDGGRDGSSPVALPSPPR